MALDKDLAARLVDALERLYIENLAYKTLFEVMGDRLPNVNQVNRLIEQAKQKPELVAKVRRELQPLRACIQAEGPLEQALQEFLRDAPTKKVN